MPPTDDKDLARPSVSAAATDTDVQRIADTLRTRLAVCSRDELRVVDRVLQGLERGREVYGPLDVKRDPRNFVAEACQEMRDTLIYLAAHEIAVDDSHDDPQGSPRLASSHPAPAAGIEAGNSSAAPPQDAVEAVRPLASGTEAPAPARAPEAGTFSLTAQQATASVEGDETTRPPGSNDRVLGRRLAGDARGPALSNPVERGLRELADSPYLVRCPGCGAAPGRNCYPSFGTRFCSERLVIDDPDATGPFETEET